MPYEHVVGDLDARSVRRCGEVAGAEDRIVLLARLVLTGERALGRTSKSAALNRHRAAVEEYVRIALMPLADYANDAGLRRRRFRREELHLAERRLQERQGNDAIAEIPNLSAWNCGCLAL